MAKLKRCENCQSYSALNNIKGICGHSNNNKGACLKNRKKHESCGCYVEK